MSTNEALDSSIKTAISVCKTIMRNGYDAYAINAGLQLKLVSATHNTEVDIACACDADTLAKIFPEIQIRREASSIALLEQDGVILRFYRTNTEDAMHPENAQLRTTERMLDLWNDLRKRGVSGFQPDFQGSDLQPFEDFDKGEVSFVGVPSVTLGRNYLLAIRALRYSANLGIPVAPPTWMAIIQSASRILDYVPVSQIMEEWRQVSAKSMWKFVSLMFYTHLLHGILPEIAALACVYQEKNDAGETETVFDHTLDCMKYYAEGELPDDWYGVFATMFHDVGKLYTAESYDGKWTFYQHHRVGAGVTRKILRRLHFTPLDVDLIVNLVRNHMMFHFMLTDRGLRRFKALPETQRLIEICRADIKARGDSYTYFNHNIKYLARADKDVLTTEPLLNGEEIMACTSLPPGPAVGALRDALLKAQIAGQVKTRDEAIAFVCNNNK